MVRTSVLLFLVSLTLAVSTSLAGTPVSEEADVAFMATASSVRASAGPGRHAGTYAVQLEYHRAEPTLQHKALLVVAQPSDTLLLVVWNGELGSPVFDEAEYKAFVARRGALASTVGPLGASHPRVTIAYDPSNDSHVEIRILDSQMQEWVVSAPTLRDDGVFSATTFFKDGVEGVDALYKHCCDCGEPCGTMCIYCSTPQFSCNCVHPWCEITCGWP